LKNGGCSVALVAAAVDYKGIDYSLNSTDPVAIAVFAAKSNRDYELNDVYLCLELDRTLGERQRCHQLVAAVIKNPPL
jgi:hypothetical protein